jgi:D-glycero-D-manno-heptose 1,7-bisphosphate phosphatase
MDDRTVIENSRRKPGPGMLLQAASEIGLELADSWMVGDLISDVLAGLNAGCRSILVASGQPEPSQLETYSLTANYLKATDLAAAVDVILKLHGA